MIKLTLKYIREQFEAEGYELLSNEYTDHKQKLEFVCLKDHKHSIQWSNWQQGRRCPLCSREEAARKRRKNFEEIKQSFEKEGYQLLTTDYKNSRQKLQFVCPAGHKFQITWGKWNDGCRCYYCGTPQKTIEEIREAFNKEGYTLLTKSYTNVWQKLDYMCPVGHKHSIRWNNWLHGYRCAHCSGNVRRNIKDIKKEFEKEKYTLLSETYKNSDQKLKFKCPKGHIGLLRWRNWKYGIRCPECANQEVGKKASQRWADPTYQHKMAKAFKIKPNKPEQALLALLNHLFPNEYKYVGDFQFFLGGKNPDFMNINGRKDLIELYGEYWHKDDDPQKRINHFRQYGFETLVVWENELKDREKLMERLREFHNKEFKYNLGG